MELTEKLAQLFSISSQQISQIYKQGPTGIHVLISDEVTASGCSRFSTSCAGLLELLRVWLRSEVAQDPGERVPRAGLQEGPCSAASGFPRVGVNR